ncbi:unnamed protein product, partial [Owenia fusiformis]
VADATTAGVTTTVADATTTVTTTTVTETSTTVATTTAKIDPQSCTRGYELVGPSTCIQCQRGFYKDNHLRQPCTRCAADKYGIYASTSRGATHVSDCNFTPYISHIYPNFGPKAGGTVITIELQHVSLDTTVFTVNVVGLQCNITRNTTEPNDATSIFVTCFTQPSVIGRGKVEVYLGDEILNQTLQDVNTTYAYMEDPVITDMLNNKAPVSGGVYIVIIGNYLTSVSDPKMSVKVQYGNESVDWDVEQVCDTESLKLMKCPVPSLEEIVIRIVNATGENITTALQKINFWSGLELDGVKSYNNLTEALPNNTNTRLQIFPDIELGKMEEIFYANTWSRIMTLSIPVATPSGGVRTEDMRVQVGDGACEVQLLTATELLCKLPDEEPGYGELEAGPDLSLFALAQVGEIGKQYTVGHVRYVPMTLIVSSAITVFVVFIAATIILVKVCQLRRRKSRQNGFIDMVILGENGEYEDTRIKLSALDEVLINILGDRKLEFRDIVIEEVLGQGHFGIVYKGTVNRQDVAIKTIKRSNCSENDLSDFMKEALVMKDFEHPNVLNLIGVALDNDIPYVILPHMANKDLKSYVQNEKHVFTIGHVLNFCLQVASGMEYLACKRFVHRDLAARNCMVASDLTVKIADFGLSRDIYSDTYYMDNTLSRPIPVRWMAPESLKDGKYSNMSDMWSYGVLMWELFTRGGTPYADVDTHAIKSWVLSGNRLDKPTNLPNEIYGIMWSCWSDDPYARPTFSDIVEMETNILKNDELPGNRKHNKKGRRQEFPNNLQYNEKRRRQEFPSNLQHNEKIRRQEFPSNLQHNEKIRRQEFNSSLKDNNLRDNEKRRSQIFPSSAGNQKQIMKRNRSPFPDAYSVPSRAYDQERDKQGQYIHSYVNMGRYHNNYLNPAFPEISNFKKYVLHRTLHLFFT